MLKITHLTPLENFRLRVQDIPEIVEKEIAPGFVCFSVMKGVSTAETYKSKWAREARGIVFEKHSGEIASRPLHKFFNVNEREETLSYKLDWANVVRVMDKRDGSMIHPVLVDGVVKFKSKKLFDSETAIAALGSVTDSIRNFCRYCLVTKNATPIFEWTAPQNRIVLKYEDPELRLLHVRTNVNGLYWPQKMLEEEAKAFGIKLVDEVKEFSSFKQILAAAETREGAEGWVIQFQSGEMVKVKTQWYMKRHHAMTSMRERDIAVLLLDEQLDDVKSMLVSEGVDIAEIEKIEVRFHADMKQLIDSVNEMFEANKEKSPRQIAEEFKQSPLFGLIMAKVNRKDPRFKEYFTKNILKQTYGLRSLGALMGSAVEREDSV